MADIGREHVVEEVSCPARNEVLGIALQVSDVRIFGPSHRQPYPRIENVMHGTCGLWLCALTRSSAWAH